MCVSWSRWHPIRLSPACCITIGSCNSRASSFLLKNIILQTYFVAREKQNAYRPLGVCVWLASRTQRCQKFWGNSGGIYPQGFSLSPMGGKMTLVILHNTELARSAWPRRPISTIQLPLRHLCFSLCAGSVISQGMCVDLGGGGGLLGFSVSCRG